MEMPYISRTAVLWLADRDLIPTRSEEGELNAGITPYGKCVAWKRE
jgi:hypothetical protein